MSRAGTTRDRELAPAIDPGSRASVPLRGRRPGRRRLVVRSGGAGTVGARAVGARAGGAHPLRSRRGSRLQRVLARVGLLVAVLATTAWVIGWSPLLTVSTVRVDGASTLDGDEIRAAADIAEGTPLLRVDVDAAAARIARLPQVSAVQVARGWPNSVVLTVTEREPVAVVDISGVPSLVDADGVVFDTATGELPADVVPLVVSRPGPDDAATRAGLAAITELPERVRTQVASVAATSAHDVTLTLTDATLVVWGSSASSATKADVVVALLARLADGTLEPAGTIDVSAPGSVVLR